MITEKVDKKTEGLLWDAGAYEKWVIPIKMGPGECDAIWTKVGLALEGKLDGDEYNFLEHNYASYGPDGLRVVGPGCGPIHIPDSPKARAKFAEMVCGPGLEE